jgi:DNA N-6-adenine-methyltransferase Dam
MASTDNWCSPPEVADPLEQYFDGPVDLDPCSNERSIIRARRAFVDKVGLMLAWDTTTYENPPYSELDAWTDKGIQERSEARVRELVRLVPVATSTAWWRRAAGVEPVMFKTRGGRGFVYAGIPLMVFTRRLKFIDEQNEIDSGARFDSVLMLYGATRRRQQKFIREFASITSWVQGAMR